MDFTFEQLSWENINKSFGKLYKNSDLIQIPGKYIDKVGKHFTEMIDEVISDWSGLDGDCTEGPNTKNSIDRDILSKLVLQWIQNSFKEEHEEVFSDNIVSNFVVHPNLSNSVVDPNPSFVRNLGRIGSSSLTQDLSYKKYFDKHMSELLSTKTTNCSDVEEGNSENSLSAVASSDGTPSASILADGNFKCKTCPSEYVENTSPTKTCGTQASSEFFYSNSCGSLANAHEPQREQYKLKIAEMGCSEIVSVEDISPTETGDALGGTRKSLDLVSLSNEHELLSKHEKSETVGMEPCQSKGGFHTSQKCVSPRGHLVNELELVLEQDKSDILEEQIEATSTTSDYFDCSEFWGLDMHDGWENIEDCKLPSISYQISRASCKKKIGSFIKRSLQQFKGHKANKSHHGASVSKQDMQGNGLLADSETCSQHYFLESGWELIIT